MNEDGSAQSVAALGSPLNATGNTSYSYYGGADDLHMYQV